jgi:hypothetical protein
LVFFFFELFLSHFVFMCISVFSLFVFLFSVWMFFRFACPSNVSFAKEWTPPQSQSSDILFFFLHLFALNFF